MLDRLGILTFGTSLLSILRPILAHPSPIFNSSSTTLVPRTLQGKCPQTHLPNESQYQIGYETFCNQFVNSDPPTVIPDTNPLVATVTLTAYDNTPIQWIYKISVDDGTSILDPVFTLDRQKCLDMFRGLLEGVYGDKISGGNKVGENYCVVDGTGGEDMSGEGVVLVMGGMVRQTFGKSEGGQWGDKVFESRQRLDDK